MSHWCNDRARPPPRPPPPAPARPRAVAGRTSCDALARRSVAAMVGTCRREAGPVRVDRVGMIEYIAAWDAQRAHAEARRTGAGPDVLMLLEHLSVYTAGKRTQPEDRP